MNINLLIESLPEVIERSKRRYMEEHEIHDTFTSPFDLLRPDSPLNQMLAGHQKFWVTLINIR